ncbi:hypothetical protein IMSAGC011_01635 [Lachnospiraceae bacterium]|nr:hypothetical protein IMSAGC011_01635 [Lachnospiraceae bacterium]
MKKMAIIAAAVAGSVLTAGNLGGSGETQTNNSDSYVGSVVDEITTQAVDELKKAFANEVSDFFTNDDLAKSLGISSEEQSQIEDSIKSYIQDYSMDEKKLHEAREAMEQLFKNVEEFSPDEFQEKISEVFDIK